MPLDPFLKKWLISCQATTSKTSFYRFHIWKFVYKQAQDFYILLFWIFPFPRSLWQIGYKICLERESRGAGGQGDFVDRWLRFSCGWALILYLSLVQLVLGGLDFFANLLATTFWAKSNHGLFFRQPWDRFFEMSETLQPVLISWPQVDRATEKARWGGASISHFRPNNRPGHH